MSKIPPALEAQLIERAAQGASTRDLSQWLAAEKGITASYKAVQRMLSRTKTERADVAKTIVRERLTKDLPKDLDHLKDSVARAKKLEKRLYRRAHKALDALNDPLTVERRELDIALEGVDTFADLALKASANVASATKTLLHFAGADTPDDAADAASIAEQSFNSRMAGLAARLGKAGVVSEPIPQ